MQQGKWGDFKLSGCKKLLASIMPLKYIKKI